MRKKVVRLQSKAIMVRNAKILRSVFLFVIVFFLGGWASIAQASTALTFQANIPMSDQAENPPVSDSVQTIILTFNDALDPNTVQGKVKLYKIDSTGKSIEQVCVVRIDPERPAMMNINNSNIEKFAEGEEYKIVLSSGIKSNTGLELQEDFIGHFATNYTFSFSGITGLEDSRTQIVIISDLHLGIQDTFAELVKNKPALTEFLNQVRKSPNIKELVIGGDVFDGWFVPMDFVLPPSQSIFFDLVAANNPAMVDALNAIIRAGDSKVTYVPGNHDLLITDADMERIFPGIHQERDSVLGLGSYTTGYSSEIVIEHGHKYNFFCAPDPLSNRDITQNDSSILPAGYFFTRIAATSASQGVPTSNKVFPEITPNTNDESQYQYYLYFQVWKNLMLSLPVNNALTDKVLKTNVDGYTLNYSINDLMPHQDAATGKLDVNLYKAVQDTWGERQTLNGVNVQVPTRQAIVEAANGAFTDTQAKAQFFDFDASKRIVVLGHSHQARILTFSNLEGKKTIYVNSGTWIDDAEGFPTMTFVVITPPKPGSAIQLVNLYKYASNKTVTQWVEAEAITNW